MHNVAHAIADKNEYIITYFMDGLALKMMQHSSFWGSKEDEILISVYISISLYISMLFSSVFKDRLIYPERTRQ